MERQVRALEIDALRALLSEDRAIAELLQASAQVNAPLLGQLREAAEAANWETVGALAHSLKGAYANLGALELADLCAQMEVAARAGDQPAIQRNLGSVAQADHRLGLEVAAFSNAIAGKAQSGRPAPPPPSTHLVVVVDDHAENRDLYRRVIAEVRGASSLYFSDPSAALSWCCEHVADLLIADYRMPVTSGLEFIGQLRALRAWREVPIVVLTGVHDEEVRARMHAAGVLAVLSKPIDKAQFVRYLDNVLNKKIKV